MRNSTPRKGNRLPLEADAVVRVILGSSEPVRLDDISAEGCSLRARPRFLRAGQKVVLRMSGLEGLIGEVRWVTGGKAGIKFELPLHIAVVDHIARMHRQIECEMID